MTRILQSNFDTYGFAIHSTPNGFVLSWTDYVANEWSETFIALSDALARLATLQACAESDWRKGFAHTSESEFAAAFLAFLHETTR